ncbi:tryptophanase [Halanaeroarchaeum sulfurireducens]|uniref:Tryptophanase n=1 Tax=Halanaeroarchaeum sulfurireducens TaxID=1604004 RepID=A0A0F7PB04_9EURY|nr:tryptophanase [Halanaeroarchaeum sulfurireducens]AKH96523.1 tryptophanase [Halanaeroarchaeum sulfurireducens]ALG80925.1 tryptophanase [Halanaeroarchaeum sulfurireducens]
MRYTSKMAGSVRVPPRDERRVRLEEAGYNLFNVPSAAVAVDLLTDSGTGTMSDEQWAAMFEGDEAYAGSESFAELERSVEAVMGIEHVVPTHQGRGAENVLYGTLVDEGDVVPNNTHFDTTRAHVVENGGRPVDCPADGAFDPRSDGDFLGNFDLDCARRVVDDVGAERVPVVVVTITNNSAAGQPVSVANLREVRAFADEIDATFVVDACRFAENAQFVQQREREFADASVAEIAHEQLSDADAVVMSGKKDGLVNVGGFVGVADESLLEAVEQRAILYEGFLTYGGMAGRDLAAFAVGLREAVQEPYVQARVDQVRELADTVEDAGLPVYRPVGGHAIYVDAGAAYDHIPDDQFPGQSLAVELYREGAVRGVELGSFAFPETERPEFVRLALPRRTYHREHIDYVGETAAAVAARSAEAPGYTVVDEPPMKELRHFSARLEPV